VVGVPRRKGGRKGGGRRYDKVTMTFDILWNALLNAVEQPAVVEVGSKWRLAEKLDERRLMEELEERLVEELGSEIFHLTRYSIPGEFCDINFLISGFLSYLFESDPPWEEEFYEAFHYYELECRLTTQDIPDYAKCLNYMARCVQVTRRFFEKLPKLVTVEAIQATV
jgi:hypothetical protein